MKIWDGISDARIVFSADELASFAANSVQEMARLTENLNLQRALLRFLDGSPEVLILDKTKVDEIAKSERGWPVLSLADGRKIQTRLLVSEWMLVSSVPCFSCLESKWFNLIVGWR